MTPVDVLQDQRHIGNDGSVVEQLVVVWQHPDTRAMSPVAMMSFDGNVYSLWYVRGALDIEGFPGLLGFPDRYRRYTAARLFPLFAQRVMDARRPDFARYVDRLGLSPHAGPWEQIGRGAGRQGDTLQLFPEPRLVDGRATCTFLVHGIRHVPSSSHLLDGRWTQLSAVQLDDALQALRAGADLHLMAERENPRNSQAVMVVDDSARPLGWAPDFLLDDLWQMCGGDLARARLRVEQINGADAPPHLRLLVHLEVAAAPHYRPFAQPALEPLAPSAVLA